MNEAIYIGLIIGAIIVAAIAEFQSNGRNLAAWAAILISAALLYAKLA